MNRQFKPHAVGSSRLLPQPVVRTLVNRVRFERFQMSEYEFHPLCKMFPVMPDDQLTDLSEDIKRTGQRQPILLLDGKIIDGRNRYLACVRAEVAPKFKAFKGDAMELVKSLNVFRRHLTDDQRAMFAAELVDAGKGRPKMGRNGPFTKSKAAKAFKVSDRSVKRALKIKRKGTPALKTQVAAGNISVHKASEVADRPKPQQRETVAAVRRIAELEEKMKKLPRGGLAADAARGKIQNEIKELKTKVNGETSVPPGFVRGTKPPKVVGETLCEVFIQEERAKVLTKVQVLHAYDSEIESHIGDYKSVGDMAERMRTVLAAL